MKSGTVANPGMKLKQCLGETEKAISTKHINALSLLSFLSLSLCVYIYMCNIHTHTHTHTHKLYGGRRLTREVTTVIAAWIQMENEERSGMIL